MGLGFRVGAQLPTGARLGGLGSPELLLQKVIDATPQRVGDSDHAAITAWGSVPNGVDFILHPAEEPLELRVVDGWLEATAKTSSAGPGYHAFAIEWLDRVADEFGLTWSWADEAREYLDETGFAETRDFESLQAEMFAWLRFVAKRLLGSEQAEWPLGLPMGFWVRGDHYAISSLGRWSREWFEAAAAADDTNSTDHGRAFFPWWNRDRDALFFKNCALVQAWVDVLWRAPVGDQERRCLENTLACFHRARALDPALELPESEIAEIEALIAGNAPERPRVSGVGFRRLPMRKPVTGSWTLEVPGYFQETSERDGGTIVFWDGTRTIRSSSFAFGPEEPPRPETGSLVFDEDGRWGTAEIDRIEQEGAVYWQLHGEMRAPGSVCVVTVCFDDADDREWAIESWRSLRRPSEE